MAVESSKSLDDLSLSLWGKMNVKWFKGKIEVYKVDILQSTKFIFHLIEFFGHPKHFLEH